MPEPVWYYARGEVERGPFTIVQIKALANAGKLRRDDLVWKEGMENWTAAEELVELFPGRRPAGGLLPPNGLPANGLPSTEGFPSVRVSSADIAPRGPNELARLATTTGRGCLFVGMFCVVLSRGCESLGEQKLSRLNAAAKLQAVEPWQRQRQPVVTELDALQAKDKLTSADQDRLRELAQRLIQLDSVLAGEELSAAQRLGVNRLAAEFRAGAFSRGLTFHGGVVFLVLGGFAMATWGVGSDRWLGGGIILVVGFAALSYSVPA